MCVRVCVIVFWEGEGRGCGCGGGRAVITRLERMQVCRCGLVWGVGLGLSSRPRAVLLWACSRHSTTAASTRHGHVVPTFA